MNDLFVLKVKSAIAEVLSISKEDIKLESRYMEDLGATSMDMLMLVMLLEEELGIAIPQEDLKEISTVAETIDYLQEHHGNALKEAV